MICFYMSHLQVYNSKKGERNTFARMVSSIGVCEAIVERGRLAKDSNDLRSIESYPLPLQLNLCTTVKPDHQDM